MWFKNNFLTLQHPKMFIAYTFNVLHTEKHMLFSKQTFFFNDRILIYSVKTVDLIGSVMNLTIHSHRSNRRLEK